MTMSGMPNVFFSDFWSWSIPLWANLMVYSTILIITGLVAAHIFRKRNAAVQSLILRVTLAAVFLCPVISTFTAALGIPGLRFDVSRVIRDGVSQVSLLKPLHHFSAINAQETKKLSLPYYRPQSGHNLLSGDKPLSMLFMEAVHPDGRLPRIPFSAFIFCIVFASFVFSFLILSRIFFYHLQIFYVRRTAEKTDPVLTAWTRDLARSMGIEPPLVLQSRLVFSPFLTGYIRPAILLPLSTPESPAITREVLYHELVHLDRKDCIWNLLSHIGTAILCYQPLMWMLTRRMEEISDEVCDDYVVWYCGDRKSYAIQLLEFARRFQRIKAETAAGVGILSINSSLGKRIRRIIDHPQFFSLRATTRELINISVLFVCMSILIGQVGFVEKSIGQNAGKKAVNTPRTEIAREQVSTVKSDADERLVQSTSTVERTGRIPLRVSAQTPKADSNPEDTAPDKETQSSSLQFQPESVADAGTTGPLEESGRIQPETDQKLSASGYADIPDTTNLAVKIAPATVGTPDTLSVSGEVKNVAAGLKANPSASKTPESKTEIIIPEEKPDLRFIKADLKTCMKAGIEFLEKNDYKGAVTAFLRARELKPRDPELNNYLGKAYAGERNYERAAVCFQTAISFKRDFADAYYNLGDIYMAYGNLQSAMSNYKIAINYNPGYASKKRTFY
jgi:beta-lactamase regulating signal transducer with metallopeptidase domain